MIEKHKFAEFNKKKIFKVDNSIIKYLKKKAFESELNRYRICLHENENHKTQEMLICLNGFNYFKTHKHPAEVSESYHMIEGKIDIIFFDDNENIIEKVSLGSNKEDNFIYRLSSPYFHLVLPQTETVIYHEVTSGPYNKSLVQYATFAPNEDAPISEIKEYIAKFND